MSRQMKRMRMGLLLLVTCMVVCAQIAEAATVVAWGSRGDEVMRIQRRLKQWGYYDGAVDGVYGEDTYQAVVRFQKKNGLKADGAVGQSTANAMGISLSAGGGQSAVSYTHLDVYKRQGSGRAPGQIRPAGRASSRRRCRP